MQQYTEDTEHRPIKKPNFFDRKLLIIVDDKLFIFLFVHKSIFPVTSGA